MHGLRAQGFSFLRLRSKQVGGKKSLETQGRGWGSNQVLGGQERGQNRVRREGRGVGREKGGGGSAEGCTALGPGAPVSKALVRRREDFCACLFV